jgi:hypothetical protein
VASPAAPDPAAAAAVIARGGSATFSRARRRDDRIAATCWHDLVAEDEIRFGNLAGRRGHIEVE